jgi:2,3-bisphosphoglycerate-independent phosphoglycerate mutase
VKYVVIIADGAADRPIPELGGLTPFEAARTPHLDRLATMGRMGAAVTTPPGFEAGSDVCSMDLLGYDPAVYHTGRAPLEAAALGIELGPADWVFRLNFVTVGEDGTPDAGLMLDHSAGALTSKEARELAAGLSEHWRRVLPEESRRFELVPGVSYRNILVDRGRGQSRASNAHPLPLAGGTGIYEGLTTVPPHEIPRKPWREFLPRGEGAATINRLMDEARAYLPGHAVNQARLTLGKRPANAAWIWGQGTRPRMPRFEERFGLRGAMITAVDLLAGIAALMGWERVACPGITSYHDTDYAMQGRVTCEAVERHDIVCCHVESPDEASHQGDWKTKVAGIEAIDAHVAGPVLDFLRTRHSQGWRMLVLPDHFTLVSTRRHDATPVPWVIAGSDIRAKGPRMPRRFTERAAAAGGVLDPGHTLMGVFLKGGVGDFERWS